jgi:hypothetical protein
LSTDTPRYEIYAVPNLRVACRDAVRSHFEFGNDRLRLLRGVDAGVLFEVLLRNAVEGKRRDRTL